MFIAHRPTVTLQLYNFHLFRTYRTSSLCTVATRGSSVIAELLVGLRAAVADSQTQLLQVSNTHTHPFNSPFSETTQVSQYQKGKTNLDFAEARDSKWQWHQLGYMQVCTSLQTDNHASTPPLSSLQAGCPSCRPTNNTIQDYTIQNL